MRNDTCAGCPYYSAAQQYQADRSQRISRPAPSEGHFTIMVDPAVEDAVDDVMKLCEQGQTDAAWKQANQLLRKHPDNHMVSYAMGVLHALKGERQDAIKWFDAAIAIYPYLVEAHFNKAVVCKEQLNLSGAILAFRKVVELGDPNDIPAIQARTFLDDMTLAIRRSDGVDLDSYLESQRLFDDAFTRTEQRDWTGALVGFRASATKNDGNAPIHGNLGLCLAALGHKEQSLAELDRALAIDPQYEPAITNRSIVEQMEEGIPLKATGFRRVEFAKTQFFDSIGEKSQRK